MPGILVNTLEDHDMSGGAVVDDPFLRAMSLSASNRTSGGTPVVMPGDELVRGETTTIDVPRRFTNPNDLPSHLYPAVAPDEEARPGAFPMTGRAYGAPPRPRFSIFNRQPQRAPSTATAATSSTVGGSRRPTFLHRLLSGRNNFGQHEQQHNQQSPQRLSRQQQQQQQPFDAEIAAVIPQLDLPRNSMNAVGMAVAEGVLPWEEPKPADDENNVPRNTGRNRRLCAMIGALIALTVLVVSVVLAVSSRSKKNEGAEDTEKMASPIPETPTPAPTVSLFDTEREKMLWEDVLRDVSLMYQTSDDINSDNLEDAILMDRDSPQSKALKWLANEDKLKLETDNAADVERLKIRYGLVVFFYSTVGENWASDLNFLSDDHECLWAKNIPSSSGVSIADSTITTNTRRQGVYCNQNGELTALKIDKNNLKGSIAPEVQALTTLKEIRITNQTTLIHTGEIIPSLSNVDSLLAMSNLQVLDFSYNAFGGILKEDKVTNLKQLRELYLNDNGFSGSIPASFATTLTRLQVLRLQNNKLSHYCDPALSSLTNLQELNLKNNPELVIKDPFYVNMEQLTSLNLEDVQFVSPLDPGISRLSLLKELNLQRSLGTTPSPTIPTASLSGLKQLHTLILSGNGLENKNLAWDNFQSESIRRLDLSLNSLEGTIPQDIGNRFPNVEHLSLQLNKFQESLPESLGSMENLEQLSVRKNYGMSGTIPTTLLESLTSLRHLDVHGTDLVGEWQVLCDQNNNMNGSVLEIIPESCASSAQCSCCTC